MALNHPILLRITLNENSMYSNNTTDRSKSLYTVANRSIHNTCSNDKSNVGIVTKSTRCHMLPLVPLILLVN